MLASCAGVYTETDKHTTILFTKRFKNYTDLISGINSDPRYFYQLQQFIFVEIRNTYNQNL